MKLDEVIDQLVPQAPTQSISHTAETFSEITKVYHEMYAGGLSNFFETNWYYFTENGKMTFPRDARVVESMASFLKALESAPSNAEEEESLLGKLETKVVWELSRTAYTVSQSARPAPQAVLPSWTDPLEARNRVQVVEALFGGDYLPRNPLTPPYHDNDSHRVRQFDFWYALAELLRQREDHHGPAAIKVREDCLARMRSLLDGRENRDLLYSTAVVREMRPENTPQDQSMVPQHMYETDPRCRFLVASKFVKSEAEAEGGSTNVVRRFSKIAMHTHIDPGVCALRAVQT